MPKRGAGRSSAATVARRPKEPTLEDAVAQIMSIKLLQLNLMKEAKKLKEENMDLCERLGEAEDLCKRLRRTEQKAVRQQIAIEQPTQVVATVSQLMSEAVLPDMEQDGAQAMQDKGKSSDDQVVAQLQESAGADGLIVEPVAGSGQEQSTVTESSSANDVVQPWPEKSSEEETAELDAVVVSTEPTTHVKEESQEAKRFPNIARKPTPFDNSEEDFVKWSREAMHYMNSAREGLSAVLSGTLDVENVLDWSKGDAEVVVLKHSQEITVSVAGSELEEMNMQVFYFLIDLTEGESLELVMSVKKGQGLEAWRKLNRRWDPGATGGVEMLWDSIFRPKKSRVGDLKASIERLEDIMRRYIVKRPTKGNFVLSAFNEETKIACLLQLLPEGLEQYVQPNKLRLSSYSLIRAEAIQCAEELLVMEEYGRRGKGKGKDKRKGNDPEGEEEGKDVESEQKVSSRPSGKGRTDMWNVKCHNCKKWGHYARDCQYERTRESRVEVDKKMIQCYNCKKWGHYAKDCWANKVDDRDEEQQRGGKKPETEMASRCRSNKEVDKKKIQCFNCQKWGHYARDCWWKKVADGRYPEYNPPPPPPALEAEETVEAEETAELNTEEVAEKNTEETVEAETSEVHAAEETAVVNAEVVSAQGAEETVERASEGMHAEEQPTVLSSEHSESESNEDQRQDCDIVSNADIEVVEGLGESATVAEDVETMARGRSTAIEQIREAWMRSWTSAAAMSGFMGAQSVREDEEWQIVNITLTQSQMIMVCMIVIVALAVWISRRCTRTSQTSTIRNSNNPPMRGPRGRALSAGYPLRARSVSSEISRSRSPDDPRVQAYIQNPRAKAYRQRAQEHLRRRRHRQRPTQEVVEPEPEIDSEMRDVGEERLLENGESYTYVEFQQFFGEDAQRQWNQAPTRDFEAEESDVRVEASFQADQEVSRHRGAIEQSASSSTARSSLSGGTTVEPHTVPEEITNDWQTFGYPRIQRVTEDRRLAFDGNDDDEVITIGERTFTRAECRQRGWMNWANLPPKGRGKGGDLRSLEHNLDSTKGDIIDKALRRESWLRMNLDTGASIHAFPSAMGVKDEEMGEYNTPESRKQYDMHCNDWYTTASGDEIPDMGQLMLTLEDVGSGDQTRLVKMIGNVTSVHKCLMSASKLCKDGKQEIWLNGKEGGVVFPSDGPIAEGLAREYDRLVELHGSSTLIPVYLEKGVYNVYFKLLEKEKWKQDESPIAEDQMVFPDNAEEGEDTVEYSAEFIESIGREIGRLIEEEEAAVPDGRRDRSRSRGRRSGEEADTLTSTDETGSISQRIWRTVPLTPEQMREMGLKYIIPSRYATGSSSQSQEQTTARREGEQVSSTSRARTESTGYMRARVLEVQGRAEAILESRAQEAMEAEDRTAEPEGEIAVRKLLKRRQSVAEAEAILERIAGEMHTSGSASSSNEPVPGDDTAREYRARVEETMRKAGSQGWRSRLTESMRASAVSQSVRLRNKYWPHLPIGVAGVGQAGEATEPDAERMARDRGQPSGHPTQP